MKKYFKLVRINENYCDYLRQFDDKVPYNKNSKKLRPFVGILFSINECMYFAPLSSPKPKHLKMYDTIDFLRLDSGRLGAINYNNMIPVKSNNIYEIDLNSKPEKNWEKYNYLLKLQIYWLNRNYDLVITKAKALYFDYTNANLPENILSRCCNFKLLEEKCNLYEEQNKVYL